MDSELAFASAIDIRRMIADREMSAAELTGLFLDRIDQLNPQLSAYLTVCHDEATAAASAADAAVQRGDALGPLHGVPISIKDLEMTKGVTTTLGSAIFRDRVPDIDSIVVERVKAAGGIILGKTNTPEFGQSGTTENLVSDPCRNPWNTDCTPGGSSGGAAAALISGLCTLATGSDGGGSIRIPSSFSGVTGIKPSQGRVPRFGGYGGPAANHFSQSGPMSRSVRDTALLLQALAGPDSRDPNTLTDQPPDYLAALEGGVSGWRVAWSEDFGYAAVDPEVVQITRAAAQVFQDMGATVEEAAPEIEGDPFPAFATVFGTASYTSYQSLYPERRDEFTQYVRQTFDLASKLSAAELSRALAYVDRLKRRFADFFNNYDILLTPAMAVTAFPIGQHPTTIAGRDVEPWWGYLPFTFPINMSGQTASSVPCGFSADGLPVGLHIVGPSGAEGRVLRAMAAFEEARPWGHHRPPVC
jgi:aspartyl-tRNA(Asn)/glutamyl-tRNA(Gln) amidotransferase subunit A